MPGQNKHIRMLLEQLRPVARTAGSRAHAPYSGFRVGAAVLDVQGRVHHGCNVESDSYGLTQCAERNALGAAIAAGARRGELSALLIHLPGDTVLPPCGACRQVMMELLAGDAWVIAACDGDALKVWRAADLMPDAFLMR